MIRKVKGGFKLYSRKTGRPLSKAPKSEAGARAQEAAIEISKAARARSDVKAKARRIAGKCKCGGECGGG